MPISPTTVKSQAIVKIAANQYILMHPETDADIVKLAVEGITATNVQDAIAELHAYIQQITGGGVVTGVKGEAEESYRVGQVNITKANVGLGNVQNLAPADMPISTATQQALDSKADSASLANYIPVSQKGTSDGVASLDSSGKVPSAQLPSYVDDVIEGTYVNTTTFNDSDGSPVTPESGKIYVDTATNQEYRWGARSSFSFQRAWLLVKQSRPPMLVTKVSKMQTISLQLLAVLQKSVMQPMRIMPPTQATLQDQSTDRLSQRFLRMMELRRNKQLSLLPPAISVFLVMLQVRQVLTVVQRQISQ